MYNRKFSTKRDFSALIEHNQTVQFILDKMDKDNIKNRSCYEWSKAQNKAYDYLWKIFKNQWKQTQKEKRK